MVSVKKSNLKRIWIIIITGILIFCAISMATTKIIYDRVFARYDAPAQVPEQLSGLLQQRQTCQFPSGENLLTGYYYSAEEPEKAHGLVVLVPGFCAGGDDYLWLISELRDYGWSIFTFDGTGSLQSQGNSQVGFSQVIPDLDAALNYVEKNQRFGYNDLVLIGHSRGGYAACCALEQREDVAAVVSISGVNSPMEAVMQMSAKAVGPISYGNYGFLWLYQAMLFGADTLNMQAWEAISQGSAPVLVVHGTRDDSIPVDTGSITAYEEKIGSSKVEYLLCDAGHTDLLFDDDGTANDGLVDHIHQFLLHSIGK